MKELLLFFGMFVMHYLGDWVLQTDVIAKYKQKDSWEDLIAKDRMYENDYSCVMELHCLFWSICIHVPIVIYEYITTGFIYEDFPSFFEIFLLASIIINMIIHYVVDELKANRKLINLRTDQSLHYIQIAATLVVYLILR